MHKDQPFKGSYFIHTLPLPQLKIAPSFCYASSCKRFTPKLKLNTVAPTHLISALFSNV